MKRFNWKIAVATFLAVIAMDAMLEVLSLLGPEDGRVWDPYLSIPFWIVNFPWFPFERHLREASDDAPILMMVSVIVFSTALLWAAAAGFFLHRKRSVETLHSTPR